MIQGTDIHFRQQVFQATGDMYIRLAGFRHARRVIMRKNKGCRIMKQRPLHHLPWMHLSTVNSAQKQLFLGDQAVLVIQKQTQKHLPAAASQAGLHIAAGSA